MPDDRLERLRAARQFAMERAAVLHLEHEAFQNIEVVADALTVDPAYEVVGFLFRNRAGEKWTNVVGILSQSERAAIRELLEVRLLEQIPAPDPAP